MKSLQPYSIFTLQNGEPTFNRNIYKAIWNVDIIIYIVLCFDCWVTIIYNMVICEYVIEFSTVQKIFIWYVLFIIVIKVRKLKISILEGEWKMIELSNKMNTVLAQ